MSKQEVTTITQKVLIPKATPKQVYDAFVDPKKHSEFTGAEATGKPVVGCEFTAWDQYITGKFVELKDGERVVQEWASTDFPSGYGPSRLELTFYAVSKGTEIIMVHSNVPREIAQDAADGWVDFYWEPMKEYFKKQSKNR